VLGEGAQGTNELMVFVVVVGVVGWDILCVLEVIRGEDTVWFLFVFVMEVKG